ncbi:hypothetical protein [Streptomyces sp. NBC_01216]|uniref:hypothetical protein n=1 Tax=unclassified Streptomyces TaxID=2593676 RepID=UPI002E1298E7|nr:hypothetical protein OG393_28225 [Streptomyces sp. NBC_01216]
MTAFPGRSVPQSVPDHDENVRRGPLWRHVVWVTGAALGGVGAGWASALFRFGPEWYGLPSAAPGPVWPYLLLWTGVGLAVATTLRGTAARVALYAPGRIAVALTLLGTRLCLGLRPEWLLLFAMAAAALTAAAVWCAFALRPGTSGAPDGDDHDNGRDDDGRGGGGSATDGRPECVGGR